VVVVDEVVVVVVVDVTHRLLSVPAVTVPLRSRSLPAGTPILMVVVRPVASSLKQSWTLVVSAARCSVRGSSTVLVFASIRSTRMSRPLASKCAVATSKLKQTLWSLLHLAMRLEMVALAPKGGNGHQTQSPRVFAGWSPGRYERISRVARGVR